MTSDTACEWADGANVEGMPDRPEYAIEPCEWTWSARAADRAVPALAVPRGCGVSSARFAAGPVTPAGPCAPVSPFWSTRFKVWLGLVPVIVAAAVPLVTVPIESVFAGPAGPWLPVAPTLPVAPVLPAGSTRLSVCDGEVPVIVAEAVPLVTVPIASVFAGPAEPVDPVGPRSPVGLTVTLTVSPLPTVGLIVVEPLTVTEISLMSPVPSGCSCQPRSFASSSC